MHEEWVGACRGAGQAGGQASPAGTGGVRKGRQVDGARLYGMALGSGGQPVKVEVQAARVGMCCSYKHGVIEPIAEPSAPREGLG